MGITESNIYLIFTFILVILTANIKSFKDCSLEPVRWYDLTVSSWIIVAIMCLPHNMPGHFTFVVCFMVVMYLLSLLLWRFMLLFTNDRSLQRRCLPLLRIISSVFIFIIMVLWSQLAFADAKDFADATARELQAQIETQGSCPETIDGWQSDLGNHLIAWHGSYGIKYPVRCFLDDSEDSFTIFISQHFGEKYIITGGLNNKLYYATE
ncbi:MAG: hypothetical protein JEZ07_02580 [Phycisphaerae bacterium]|nr:hypothetical protein [Phycisphaerae bacterium]